MSLNLATMLREAARSNPNKPAILYDGGQITYRELDQLTDHVAASLRREGIGPHDAVAVQVPNLPHFVIAYFAILKNGSVVVPLNVLLKSREIDHQLRDSDSRALITWSGSLDEAARGAAEAGVDQIFVVTLPGEPPPATGRPVEELLSGPAPMRSVLEPTEPGDPAVIVFTSGTTGRPKGAELTHFQLYMNAEIPGRLFGILPDDVVMVVLPLFHVFGLSSEFNICVRFGATMSLVPRFTPDKVLEVIQRDAVTVFEGVPTMYIALLNHPDAERYDLSTLRVAISGGAPLPAEVLDDFETRFGVTILEGYGLTETASTTSFNISAEERKIYSVGKPIWGVEVEIWDEQGQPQHPGSQHVGEIVVRGVNTMRGYYRNPEATDEAFAGGWFHTGDLGYVDEDGYLFIVDRKKDLVIRGGYNVYPREVEEVLYTHPKVAEAAVVGIPHPRLGEELKAYVQLKPGSSLGEEELIAFTKERLAAYKYPRVIEFWDELPKLATGKIAKEPLREHARGAAPAGSRASA